MLTNKDYCDYETCVALKELGYNDNVDWYIYSPSYKKDKQKRCWLCWGIPPMIPKEQEQEYIPRVSLYEAQKWLREEKNIIVDVRYGVLYYNVVLNHTITGGRHIVKDKNNRIADFTEYEEALSKGIKEAVKILKEKDND